MLANSTISVVHLEEDRSWLLLALNQSVKSTESCRWTCFGFPNAVVIKLTSRFFTLPELTTTCIKINPKPNSQDPMRECYFLKLLDGSKNVHKWIDSTAFLLSDGESKPGELSCSAVNAVFFWQLNYLLWSGGWTVLCWLWGFSSGISSAMIFSACPRIPTFCIF